MISIYTLNCPITGAVRYCGITSKSLKRRFQQHITNSRLEKCYRSYWISSLLNQNLEPIMVKIDEVPEENWQIAEIVWIASFRAQGFDLVNGTDGGDGLMNPSQEARARISAAHLGTKRSLESREKMSKAALGNKKSLGNRASEETRAKMTVSQKLRWAKKKGLVV